MDCEYGPGGKLAARHCIANSCMEWGLFYCTRGIEHEHLSSALLDGLDVRDVTEAGG